MAGPAGCGGGTCARGRQAGGGEEPAVGARAQPPPELRRPGGSAGGRRGARARQPPAAVGSTAAAPRGGAPARFQPGGFRDLPSLCVRSLRLKSGARQKVVFSQEPPIFQAVRVFFSFQIILSGQELGEVQILFAVSLSPHYKKKKRKKIVSLLDLFVR